MNDKTIPAVAATPVTRRVVFAGAGTVGALAAVAAVLPRVRAPEPVATAAAPAASADSPGGYQLTEHVKQYYQTARI